MGTAIFGTRCWTWNLLHHGLRILQIHNFSPLILYLPIFHFLSSPTAPHFYSSLFRCKLTVLYLLASMLYYFQYKNFILA